MAKQSLPQPEPLRPVAITPQEEAVVDRIRMTPADRKAEDDARRQAKLAALPADQRQAQESRLARLEAMKPQERQTFLAGQRLAAIARALRYETQHGLDLAAATGVQEGTDAEAIAWLSDQLKPPDPTPVKQV
jgi:hypothetical protein